MKGALTDQDVKQSSVEWEDSKRLDWLQSELAGPLELTQVGSSDDSREWAISGYCLGTDDLRKAIDAARDYLWLYTS